MKMADKSARRESRRRKLLLSSEERLQKIKQLNDKHQGSYVEAKEDVSAAVTPLLSIDQAQSENAHEGANVVSTLPLEDSQVGPLGQIDCERTNESVDQTSDAQGLHQSATKEQLGSSEIGLEEAETNSHGDVECLKSSVTTAEEVLQDNPIGHVQRTDETADSLASPDEADASSICNFPERLTRPTHKDEDLLQSTSDSPCVPLPEHIQLSPAGPCTSLPQHPQPQVAARDEHTLPSTPQTGQVWRTRDLVVVLVAILMRGLLVVHWFKSVSGQSLIISFIALEVAFFYIHPQTLRPSGGVVVRMLSFAAVMCSIPQAVIDKFRLSLSIINAFCEDLALYLFVFIMTHAVVEIIS